MKLRKVGPDVNIAGEGITEIVAQSENTTMLRQRGEDIAQGFEAYDAQWVELPYRSGRFFMEVQDNVLLKIVP